MDITSAATLYLQHLGKQRPLISGLSQTIFPNGGPEPTSLVEISGSRKSGKTLLLMQLISQCVTQCDVIFLNITNKIDAQLIRRHMKDTLQNSNPCDTSAELEENIDKCMDSLQVINCFSSIQLEMAIKALDQYILLDNGRISLITVDSLCEFYWLDLEPEARTRKYTYYMTWLARLRKICNKFYVSCLYTVDSSFNKKPYPTSRSVVIDYKLQLNYLKSGERTLNDKSIVITDKGAQIKE